MSRNEQHGRVTAERAANEHWIQDNWFVYSAYRNRLRQVTGITTRNGRVSLNLVVDGERRTKTVTPEYPLIVSYQNLVGERALPILVEAREVSDMEAAKRKRALLVAETSASAHPWCG